MAPDEYEWYIKMVLDRYNMLNLSREQAVKVLQFERDRDNLSEKHQFSPWEEWDYELTVFSEILNKEQFEKHENWLREAIVKFEESLKETDEKATNEISYHQATNDYFTQHFIPGVAKLNLTLLHGTIYKDRAKLVLLKEEYKKYLNDQKKQILTSHFRNNRRFQPNHFKLALLHHSRAYLWPEFEFFKYNIDDATKTVADYLYEKVKLVPDSELSGLNKCLEELKSFNDINFKKYYGDVRGWHVVYGDQDEQIIRKNKIMSLLLFDKNGYMPIPEEI